MDILARLACLLLALSTTTCAPGFLAGAFENQGIPSRLRFRTVLVAGDSSIAVFDRATAAVGNRLSGAADIQRFSSTRAVISREGAGVASLDRVLGAISTLRPARGQGCLVFATSHGAREQGLALTVSEDFLTPASLDDALARGCGEAPTVVIISGCYSGNFARPPMIRPNRVILTAARADRTSFGCSAEFEYTVYDRCLLTALDNTATWREAHDLILGCVEEKERELNAVPSGPRAFFGQNVAGLPIPGR